MNINSIRTARRMAVAASGMVAAVTLVVGAGAASAGPVLSPSAPTSAVCDGSTKCEVHDGDGIKTVVRKVSGTKVTATTSYNPAKTDVTVLSEGKYTAFTVTDTRGYKRTFTLIAPG